MELGTQSLEFMISDFMVDNSGLKVQVCLVGLRMAGLRLGIQGSGFRFTIYRDKD